MKTGLFGVLLCLGAAAPVFARETADDSQAPAAARAVSGYAHYELRDITAQVTVHPKVMTKLTTELKLKLDGAARAVPN